MKKKIILSLLMLFLIVGMTGCNKKSSNKNGDNNNNQTVKMPTEEEIRKATIDAPMTDIEKEVINGEGGIQNNYLVENVRVENGYIVGNVTNQGSEKKSISMFILMMNGETGEQLGTTDFIIGEIEAGGTREFVNPVEEIAWGATSFEARITEINE